MNKVVIRIAFANILMKSEITNPLTWLQEFKKLDAYEVTICISSLDVLPELTVEISYPSIENRERHFPLGQHSRNLVRKADMPFDLIK